jgi:WD40 repeat protein
VRVWQLGQADNVPLLGYQLRDSSIGVEGAGQAILSLAWSPDGSRLAAGFGDRITRVWRAEPGDAYRRLIGVTLPLSIAWSPDGTQLAAGGLETFRLADAVKTGYSDDFIPGLFDMDLSPDGATIALAEFSQIEVRSLADGTPLQVIGGMVGEVNEIDYSPDGSLLVAACADGTTRLFRSADGRYLAELGEPTSPMLAVDFSPNGRWIAAAGEDMRVRVFRVNDGLQMLNLKEPYVSYELAFAPNVDQLASLTTNGVVLRAFGGEIQRVAANLLGTVGGVSLHDLVYSPGSEFLALVGNDVIRVIDPATRDDIYSLSGDGGALPWSVAFSPDNAFLAVGWSDGSVRFYWAADGTPLNRFQAHPAGVTRLAFTLDNRLLVTLGAEDTLRLWGVPSE